MGKTVVAEETVRDKINQLFNQSKVRSGLLLGQLVSNKACVLSIVPTPEEEDDPIGNSAASHSFSLQWALDHARQVERMLPGGMHIIGAFVFSRPEVAQELQGPVRRLLSHVVGTQSQDGILSSWLSDKICSSGLCWDAADQNEAVYLQVCATTHKITCRTVNVQDRQSPLKPAELKFHSFAQNWTKVCCTVSVDERLSVGGHKSVDVRLCLQELSEGLLPFARAVCAAQMTCNNCLKQPDELLVSRSSAGSRQSSKQQSVTVDLWASRTRGEESTCREVDSNEQKSHLVAPYNKFGILRGQVGGCVFLHEKASWQEAAHEMKIDLLRSLSSRLSLLWEDVQQSDMPDEVSSIREAAVKEQYHVLPRRVFIPLGKLDVFACDYMFQDEDVGQCIQRAHEILAVEPDVEKCVNAENGPPPDTELSFLVPACEPAIAQLVNSDQKTEKGSGKQITAAVWAVLGAGVVAVIAALSSLLLGED